MRCSKSFAKKLAAGVALAVLMAAMPSLATAQEAAESTDVVVTGTLLRGIAPTGTNVVGVSADDITRTGATNTQDILSQIPQISSNFLKTTAPGQEVGLATNRPNIRNLGGLVGSATTLILLNNHRMVGAGAITTVPDPAILPTAVLERVEIVPDGGSSIYGSDAIGGVINFVTRKRFDGIQLSGQAGWADGYDTHTASILAGKDWDSGSGYLAYEWFGHTNILGRDRNYDSLNLTAAGGTDFRSAACAPGNITVGLVNYALPGRVAGTRNLCDTTDYADLYPSEIRNSVFGSITQDVAEGFTLDAHALYSKRENRLHQPAFSASNLTITNTNPYFSPIGAETSQSLAFDYSPVFGPSYVQQIDLEATQVTAGATKRFGEDWQVRLQGNYGRSKSVQQNPLINPAAQGAALAGTTTATALNPYNLSATNPAVLANLRNFEFNWTGTQTMKEARLAADGPLFSLPGGDVRLAVGAEYHEEEVSAHAGNAVPGSNVGVTFRSGERNVTSLFGEVNVPIIGDSNATSFAKSLRLSLSGRWDDYDDVGDTFNPKIGLTYEPNDWLAFRANYGTSFNAPSISDTVAGVDSRANVIPFSPFLAPGADPSNGGRRTIVLAGSNPNLEPQEADTYSIGMDIKPTLVPGLKASLTYYNVDFTNQIGFPPPGAVLFTPQYARFITLNPSQAQTTALIGSLPLVNVTSIADLYAGTSPYLIIDARRNNLGGVKQDGLDFAVDYTHETGFGSLNANFAGTYILTRKSTPVTGAAAVNDLDFGNSRFQFVAGVGATAGQVSGRLSVNHSQGYKVVNIVKQTRIDSFNTVDFFASYDVKSEGMLKDLRFTLNVENLFDEDPPFLNASGLTTGGFGNGSTLGRTIMIGATKKF